MRYRTESEKFTKGGIFYGKDLFFLKSYSCQSSGDIYRDFLEFFKNLEIFLNF